MVTTSFLHPPSPPFFPGLTDGLHRFDGYLGTVPGTFTCLIHTARDFGSLLSLEQRDIAAVSRRGIISPVYPRTRSYRDFLLLTAPTSPPNYYVTVS